MDYLLEAAFNGRNLRIAAAFEIVQVASVRTTGGSARRTAVQHQRFGFGSTSKSTTLLPAFSSHSRPLDSAERYRG